MTIRVLEINPAAAVVAVDFAGAAQTGVGPMRKTLRTDAGERSIEVFFADQERIVLGGDFAFGLVAIERDAVAQFDHQKWSEPDGRWLAEKSGEKRRGGLLVVAPDNGVIELHAHVGIQVAAASTIAAITRVALLCGATAKCPIDRFQECTFLAQNQPVLLREGKVRAAL